MLGWSRNVQVLVPALSLVGSMAGVESLPSLGLKFFDHKVRVWTQWAPWIHF